MIKLTEYKFDTLYEMGSGISTKPEQAGHGAPFVSFSSIYNNAILPEELPDLMDTSKEEQEKYSVKEGDIFLTRTSEVLDELAISSVALKDYPNATFSGFAKRLRPIQNDVTYAKFMAFFMRSNYFRKIINCKAVMTLRASFNEEIFSYIKIVLPEYEQQIRTGDLFWAIEQKIRNNNKINSELEAMAKTVYDYWFLQFEFPNEEGKPYKSCGGKMVWNEELKIDIPEGWSAEKLIEQVDFVQGYPFSSENYLDNGKYKIYTIKNVQDGYIIPEVDNRLNELPVNMDERCLLTPGDIIMSLTGNVGRVGQVFEENILLNQRVLKIIPGVFGKIYIYLMLRNNTMKERMELISTGTSQKNLSPVNLGEMKVVVPNKNILIRFEQKYSSIYDKMIINKIENKELISLRDFLLPLLMNGQVGFKK